MTTVTDYEYDPNFFHHQVKSTSITNSDGKMYKTEILYPHDFTSSGNGIWTTLIDQNRIQSVGQELFADNDKYAGQLNEYSLYNSVGPYIQKIKVYEEGSDGVGNYVDNIVISDYNPFTGKINLMNSEGWNDETFTYSATGQLASRTYDGFTTSYDYETMTDRLKTITEIDGQNSEFEYDGLGRVIKNTQRTGNIITNIDYGFSPNFIETENLFGTDVELVTRQEFDGLGRKTKTIRKYYKQGGGDVDMEYFYNTKGLVEQERDYSGNTTSYLYYNDPLNRLLSRTDPEGFTYTNTYAANGSQHPDYASGELYETKTIDPDNLESVSLTDKLGRQVMSEKKGNGQSAKTYMHQDDKGRLVTIIPPDATINDAGLIYSYTYDGDDNVLTKKLPDMGLMEYSYDARNLTIGVKDPLMGENGKDWLCTIYDNFGRPVKMGFGSIANQVPTVSDLLVENFYDGIATGNSSNPIYKGKMDKSIVNILDGYEKGPNNMSTCLLYTSPSPRDS